MTHLGRESYILILRFLKNEVVVEHMVAPFLMAMVDTTLFSSTDTVSML